MTRSKSRRGSRNRKPRLTQRMEPICFNCGGRSGRHRGNACRESKPVCETCSDAKGGCKMGFEKCDGRHREDACTSSHTVLKRKIKKIISIEDKPITREKLTREKPKAVDQEKCCAQRSPPNEGRMYDLARHAWGRDSIKWPDEVMAMVLFDECCIDPIWGTAHM